MHWIENYISTINSYFVLGLKNQIKYWYKRNQKREFDHFEFMFVN